MAMVRQDSLKRSTAWNENICDNCGKRMGSHWVFQPEKMADVGPGPNGRKPDGKYYCNSDQVGWAKSFHQRQLIRTMEKNYDPAYSY